MGTTKQIGHVTLHEGTNGRWVGVSEKLGEGLQPLLDGAMTTEQYVENIKQRVRDSRRAHALLGKKARA